MTDRQNRMKKSLKKKLIRKHGGCQKYPEITALRASRNDPDGALEVHHVVPRAKGGHDSYANALLLSRRAHIEIHALIDTLTSHDEIWAVTLAWLAEPSAANQ